MKGETYMFEIVLSLNQQKTFENTWEYFCELYGWYNDPYSTGGLRYLLLLPSHSKTVIGTIEFIPYDEENPNSTVEGHFQFSKIEKVKEHKERVWEIDKLCLHKDFQRNGHFEGFLEIFYHHAQEYRPKYYIGLMEKRFFRMVRIIFGVYIIQVGKEIEGETTILIPVVLDMEKIMNNEKMALNLFNKGFKHKNTFNIKQIFNFKLKRRNTKRKVETNH